MSRLPLLIGESPSKRGATAEDALRGTIARRLARLLGLTVAAYESAFERVNVLPDFLGKAPGKRARKWPPVEARQAALAMLQKGVLDERELIVLFGRRVAAAFGLPETTPWFQPTALEDPTIQVVCCPHPSGASRWWNAPENMKQAELFFRAKAEQLELITVESGVIVPDEGTRRRSRAVTPGAPEEPVGGEGINLSRLPTNVREAFTPLKPIERRFVVCYCSSARGNATLAARQAGVIDRTGNTGTFGSRTSALMYNPDVRRAIEAWMEAYALSAVELTYQLKDLAEVNLGPFVMRDELGNLVVRTVSDDEWQAHKHWIKEIECSAKTGRVTRVVLHDALAARKELARILKLHTDQPIIALNLYLRGLTDEAILAKLMEIASTESRRGAPVGVPMPATTAVEGVRASVRTLPAGSDESDVDDAEATDALDGSALPGDEEDI